MARGTIVLALLFGLAPALAGAAEPEAAEGIPFRQAVDTTIDRVIIPAYTALATQAAGSLEAMTDLCAMADADALDQARTTYLPLVVAWSRVEMIRFGPVRDQNRYERLFFWPDRRGLGLRQVQRILADEDASALSVESLQDKSVAVQGLLALEYVLFGNGSDRLAAGAPETFRCRYGTTIAGAIARTTRTIADAWIDESGFAAVMRDAGPDNPVYRSHGEVVQQIIQSARDQLMLVRDLKIARPLNKTAAAANPKAAPFWRSNAVIPAIESNLDAALDIIEQGGIAALLPAGDTWLSDSLAFELGQAEGAIDAAGSGAPTWNDALRDTELHQKLAYALIPLGGAVVVLEERMPAALGLIAGFNALDGD